MGGFIAAEMAIQDPERVERLVLISAAGHHLHRTSTARPTAVIGARGADHHRRHGGAPPAHVPRGPERATPRWRWWPATPPS